jgi:putative hydroxymethylpyrimidine transporter CytX
MDEKAPAWGIEPVPERLRVLGLVDLTLLWGSLGVSLLVIVIGALIVPALSLPEALVAIVVGSLVGNLILGLAGLIGADARVPSMVLMRAPLGRRGSYLPTAVNVAQLLGWATFELIVIATAAAALSDELLGFEARWAWTLVFGAVAAWLAFMGPVGVVRRFLRRFAVWLVLASLVYLSWWALAEADLSALWNQPGEGGSMWLAIDLVIAITVTWMPLAADYTRFARDRRGAFFGTGVGYFLAGTWMLVLGVFLVLSRGLSDPAELPAAVAAAGGAAALALLAVTVDETDEAFANIYSAAVSCQNLLSQVPQRLLIGAVSALATVGALTIPLRSYETFLLLLGSAFVPLFGVLLADWLLSGRRYRPEDVFGAPTLRPAPIVAWLAGFALYHWLHEPPLGPSWWVELVERTNPPELGLGASLPSLALAFGLTAAAIAVERRVRPSPAAGRG